VAQAQGVEAPRLPLRTALDELGTFRAEYAEAYNRKDGAAVSAMYAPDAIVIESDGTVLNGAQEISAKLKDSSASPHIVIESDSVKVFGNTAVDVGTVRMHPEGGAEMVAHYLVVLRRNMQNWKLVSVAVVPVTAAAK
jgi:ketosteroid isomerase-like protein